MFDENKAEEAAKGTIKFITMICKWLLINILNLIFIVFLITVTGIIIADHIDQIKWLWNASLLLSCEYIVLVILVSMIFIASLPIQFLFKFIFKDGSDNDNKWLIILAMIITDCMLDYFKILDLMKPLTMLCT
jgi:hypothetical protein